MGKHGALSSPAYQKKCKKLRCYRKKEEKHRELTTKRNVGPQETSSTTEPYQGWLIFHISLILFNFSRRGWRAQTADCVNFFFKVRLHAWTRLLTSPVDISRFLFFPLLFQLTGYNLRIRNLQAEGERNCGWLGESFVVVDDGRAAGDGGAICDLLYSCHYFLPFPLQTLTVNYWT